MVLGKVHHLSLYASLIRFPSTGAAGRSGGAAAREAGGSTPEGGKINSETCVTVLMRRRLNQ
jgi:hypothetical protein